MLAAPPAEAGPARRVALAGAVTECVAATRMERRLGPLAGPLRQSRLLRAGEALSLAGAVAGVTLGRRSRIAAAVAGAALLAGSACTRFGIFQAGMDSANDPGHTVQPQRRRLAERRAAAARQARPQEAAPAGTAPEEAARGEVVSRGIVPGGAGTGGERA